MISVQYDLSEGKIKSIVDKKKNYECSQYVSDVFHYLLTALKVCGLSHE